MSKILGLAAVSAFALSASSTALRAEIVDDAVVKAEIVATLTLTEETQMDFGKITTDVAAGTIIMSPAGVITGTAVARHYAGTQVPGEFKVVGTNLASIVITLPSSAVTLQGPTETMTATAFNHDAGATPALSGIGEATFKVGAQLNINNSQEVGAYSGTYTVAVVYGT